MPIKTGRARRGFTLIEVLTVTLMVAVLAAIAVPLVENTIRREREIELRRSLRTVREALDQYHDFVIENKIQLPDKRHNFPEKLEELVKGIEYKNPEGKTMVMKFLRRIPFDPITRSHDWGLRSFQDKFNSSSWGGENVWDIYCDSDKKALDGSYYRDW